MRAYVALAVGPATPGTGGPDVGHCKMSAKIWWLSDRNPLDKGLNPKQERKKPLRYENCYAGTWADKYSSRRVTRTESKTKMNKHRSDTNRPHSPCSIASSPLYRQHHQQQQQVCNQLIGILQLWLLSQYHRYSSSSSLNYFSLFSFFCFLWLFDGRDTNKTFETNK